MYSIKEHRTGSYMITNGELIFRYMYDKRVDAIRAEMYLIMSKDNISGLFTKPDNIALWQLASTGIWRALWKGEKGIRYIKSAEGQPNTPSAKLEGIIPDPHTAWSALR